MNKGILLSLGIVTAIIGALSYGAAALVTLQIGVLFFVLCEASALTAMYLGGAFSGGSGGGHSDASKGARTED